VGHFVDVSLAGNPGLAQILGGQLAIGSYSEGAYNIYDDIDGDVPLEELVPICAEQSQAHSPALGCVMCAAVWASRPTGMVIR